MSTNFQSPQQFAASSGWPERMIRNLITSKKLRHVRIGRRIFIPSGSMEEYIKNNMVEPCNNKKDNMINQ